MIGLIFWRIRRAALWAAGGLLALCGVWTLAKRDQRQETALQAAERHARTRKRIDDADTGVDDPALLRDWLRERGQ